VSQQQRNTATQHDRHSEGLLPTRRNTTTANSNNVNNADDGEGDEDGITSMLALNVRSPPHISSAFHATVAHEGVIPFRYTRASVYESSHSVKLSGSGVKLEKDDAVVVANAASQMAHRKDRARIFTKLFSSTRTESSGIAQPPSRGSNVVLTVPSAEVDCTKLRKVLFLIGSYYNLFLLVALDNHNDGDGDGATDGNTKAKTRNGAMTETERYIQFNSTMTEMESALRGNNDDATKPSITNTKPTTTTEHTITTSTPSSNSKQPTILPQEVLPSHRIVGTTSIGGRVAFVRQLPKRPEFVLEYEAEVSTQLTRFGFAVLLYSKAVGGGCGVSGVGKELISG